MGVANSGPVAFSYKGTTMGNKRRHFLRVFAATHRRRCAIRQGVRETDPDTCDHSWDLTKRWCKVCGVSCIDWHNREKKP